MQPNHPEEDPKLLFQKVEPTGTTLQNRIISQIENEKTSYKKERFLVKYKVSFLILLGALLTASTGFAAVKYQSLTSESGKVLFEQKPVIHQKSNHTEEEQKRISQMNEIWVNKIKPGELAFIYIVPNNPNQEINLRAKSHEITSFNELQKMVRIPSRPLFKELLSNNKYKFKNASVHMEHGVDIDKVSEEEKAEIASKLLAKAQANGQDYALMPIPFKDDFWLTTINYVSKKKEFSLTILNAKEHSVTAGRENERNFTSDKIKINEVEVIQTRYNGVTDELIWAYEDQNTKYVYTYNLRASKGKFSDEELLDIAKQIIPKIKK